MATTRVSRRRFIAGAGAAAAASALGLRMQASAAERPAHAAGRVRFGIQPRPEHTTYRDLLRAWQAAEELGFDSAFVFDHFMPIDDRPGPCLEGWTLLAALATQSRRLKVGVLVTGNTYRHPAILAKMAATVDQVSNGRLILGMGAGWFEAEHVAYGIPFYTASERAKRLVEAVKIIKSLFEQDRTTFAGRYYETKDAPLDPKSVQKPHPPILIGGMGPRVIQPLAARHADIWNFFVPEGDPDRAREIGDRFDALCRRVGRDPDAVEKSITLRPNQVAGRPAAEVRRQLHSLSAAGVRHFILSLPAPYDLDMLRAFAKGVMPALRTT